MRRVFIPIVAALALALAAAGCGGDGGSTGSGSAEIAPANSFVYALFDTDFEGEGWEQVRSLVERFPEGSEALGRALAKLDAEEVDFERDVEPALGPEVALVVLPPADGGDPPFALLTQPDDPERLDALLEQSKEDVVQGEIDGWTVVAETQAAIDALRDGEGSLAESDAFDGAMGRLPEDALARIFVNGGAATSLAFEQDTLTPDAREITDCVAGEGGAAAAIAISAEDEGFRFEGASELGDVELPEGESTLADTLPGEALVFFSIRGLGEQMRQTLRCASDANEELAQQIAAAEFGLGVSIEEEILPLFAGETAVAVYGADPMPSVVVATEVEDDEAALRTLDRIAERASAFLGGFEVEELELDGVPARRLVLEDAGAPEILYAVSDGRLVGASSEAALRAALTGEEPLAEDADFEAAAEAAGAPGETSGLLYADIEAALAFAFGTLDAGGSEAETARRNLEPLRSLFAWMGEEDGWATVEGLLEIE